MCHLMKKYQSTDELHLFQWDKEFMLALKNNTENRKTMQLVSQATREGPAITTIKLIGITIKNIRMNNNHLL